MNMTKREIEEKFYDKTPTTDDIKCLDNVPVEVAAKYLGVSKIFVMDGLRSQRLPIGAAVKKKIWMYHISPGKLIAYKAGTQNVIINIYEGGNPGENVSAYAV